MLQKITGTLTPGAHAGSYNGQDAYNDLLIPTRRSNVDELERRADIADTNEQQRGGGVSVCQIRIISTP